MTSEHIELHIESLVLHGFDGVNRVQLGIAVEQELSRLLTEQGIPPALQRGGRVAQLDGGSFPLSPDMTPEATGIQIARTVYRGLEA